MHALVSLVHVFVPLQFLFVVSESEEEVQRSRIFRRDLLILGLSVVILHEAFEADALHLGVLLLRFIPEFRLGILGIQFYIDLRVEVFGLARTEVAQMISQHCQSLPKLVRFFLLLGRRLFLGEITCHFAPGVFLCQVLTQRDSRVVPRRVIALILSEGVRVSIPFCFHDVVEGDRDVAKHLFTLTRRHLQEIGLGLGQVVFEHLQIVL